MYDNILDEIVISDEEVSDVENIEFEVVNIPDENAIPSSKQLTCDLCHMTFKDETHFMLHWKIEHDENNNSSFVQDFSRKGHSSTEPIEIDISDNDDDTCTNNDQPRVGNSISLDRNQPEKQGTEISSEEVLTPPVLTNPCTYAPVNIQSDGCTFSVAPIPTDTVLNFKRQFQSQQSNVQENQDSNNSTSVQANSRTPLPDSSQEKHLSSVAFIEPCSPCTEVCDGPKTIPPVAIVEQNSSTARCDTASYKPEVPSYSIEQDTLVSSTTTHGKGPDDRRDKSEPGKKGKKLTIFSKHQLEQLISSFQKNRYPRSTEIEDLASCLDLTFLQVKTWFENRRAKRKKLVQKGAKSSQYPGALSGEVCKSATQPRSSTSSRSSDGQMSQTHSKQRKPGPGIPFSQSQREQLHKMFRKTQYPTMTEREELAASIGLTKQQVRVWFVNERTLHKKYGGARKRTNFFSAGQVQQPKSPTSSSSSEGQMSQTHSKKRHYRFLSKEELRQLNASFQKHQYPSSEEIENLASSLGLGFLQVKFWYQNQRTKCKKLRQKCARSSQYQKSLRRSITQPSSSTSSRSSEGQILQTPGNKGGTGILFSQSQREQLHQAFKRTQYPSIAERKELAASIGLTEKQIRVWFANERKIYKRLEGGERRIRTFTSPRSSESQVSQPNPKSFTQSQREQLHKMFKKTQYPCKAEREELAASTGLTKAQIRIWFANERIKFKKYGTVQRSRRGTYFSTGQLQQLQAAYQTNQNPSLEEKVNLATSTGLMVKQVYDWFRYQQKKHGLPKEVTKCQQNKQCLPEEETMRSRLETEGREKDVTAAKGGKELKRTFLPKDKFEQLRKVFQETQWPTHSQMRELASLVCLTPTQVNKWFNNQRFHLQVRNRRNGVSIDTEHPCDICNKKCYSVKGLAVHKAFKHKMKPQS